MDARVKPAHDESKIGAAGMKWPPRKGLSGAAHRPPACSRSLPLHAGRVLGLTARSCKQWRAIRGRIWTAVDFAGVFCYMRRQTSPRLWRFSGADAGLTCNPDPLTKTRSTRAGSRS
jgi:hypothetical protein